jgi:glycosyltransferase involved in cell wall biosynthesis
MIKILHFVLIDFEWDMTGPINQLVFENTAAKSLEPDILWEIKCFTLGESVNAPDFVITFTPSKMKGLLGRIHNNIKLRRTAFRWLKAHQHQYDAIIMRYNYADPFVYWHSRWFKNVFTIHHTFEIEQIRLGGGIKQLIASFLGKPALSQSKIVNHLGNGLAAIVALIEQQVGKRILAKTKGIIGVTHEIAEYENARLNQKKPSYSFPNGIDVSSIELVADERSGIPKLVFIASDVSLSWHGLDLLIDALKNSSELFELHIIGGGYQPFAEVCAEDERFVFHSAKIRSKYKKIFAKSDVGIGAFAHKRVGGMKEACTLKVREYLASGLPVYSGHQDGALPENFLFYNKGSLEVEAILNYAKKCRQVSREEIRKQATLYIDKKQLMLYLAQWIAKQV